MSRYEKLYITIVTIGVSIQLGNLCIQFNQYFYAQQRGVQTPIIQVEAERH